MCERTFTWYLIIVGIYISPQFWTFDSINYTLQGRQMTRENRPYMDCVISATEDSNAVDYISTDFSVDR